MGKFKALIGDMFNSDAQTLVNTVNCVGVMGKGVALKFKERFPDMFADYARRCERKAVKLGEPYLYEDKSGVKILNFPTKDHWRSASRLGDIEKGLTYLLRGPAPLERASKTSLEVVISNPPGMHRVEA